MNSSHRNILQAHREDIVKDLRISHVRESLIGSRIFTDRMWAEIESAGTTRVREDKASALMAELPTRGPDAFWAFCEALMTGGYEHLGKPLIEDALSGEITSIREAYKACLSRGQGETVLKALKNFIHCIKVRGKKESEQTVTSLKHIKHAMKSDLFDKSNVSILTDILDLVEKLKNIRETLFKYGSTSEHVDKLSTMLADGADVSDLYNVTVRERSDYLKQFGMKGLDSSSISKFGSVLVLVPYLCDLSEKAVQRIKQPLNDPTDGVSGKDGGEAALGAEGITSYGKLDDDLFDQQEKSVVMSETALPPETDSQSEDTQMQTSLLEEFQKLLLVQQEEINRKFEEKLDQTKEELGKKMEETSMLMERTEEIKDILYDVSDHLNDIKEALRGQSEREAKVRELERKVTNLRDKDMDVIKLVEEIKKIKREAGALKDSFQEDPPAALMELLVNMNQNLDAILSTLKRDPREEARLSDAINVIKRRLKAIELPRFAEILGFSDREFSNITARRPTVHQQKDLLFRQWREKNGNKATVEALQDALHRLTDTSAISSSGAARASLPDILRRPGTSVQMLGTQALRGDSKAAVRKKTNKK